MDKVEGQLPPAIEKEKAAFQIFGSVDLNDKGVDKSTYPAWYFTHLRDDLKNEIDRMETQLDAERIPRSEIQITKERLQQKKLKLREIDSAAMELRGKQKDRVSKVYGELGEAISERLFSRSDMKKGLADAHEEMKRMTEPCVPIVGDAAMIARASNVKVVKGKVTREGAAKVWKILGRALGESSNTESLRRDA